MTASSDPVATMDAIQQALDANTISNAYHVGQSWSPEMVEFLSLSILGFSGFTLVLCTIVLWRSNAQAQQALRLFGVISIIGLSTLLLVVGYSNEQLTPIIGLFGAIAGYLLGKDSKVP